MAAAPTPFSSSSSSPAAAPAAASTSSPVPATPSPPRTRSPLASAVAPSPVDVAAATRPKATVVGITAPTKDDWSHEFDFPSPGDDDLLILDAHAHMTLAGPCVSPGASPVSATASSSSSSNANANANSTSTSTSNSNPNSSSNAEPNANSNSNYNSKLRNSNANSNTSSNPQARAPASSISSTSAASCDDLDDLAARRHAALFGLQPRTHSRRIVRSLDWAKIHSIHQAQFPRASNSNGGSSGLRHRENADHALAAALTAQEEAYIGGGASASLDAASIARLKRRQRLSLGSNLSRGSNNNNNTHHHIDEIDLDADLAQILLLRQQHNHHLHARSASASVAKPTNLRTLTLNRASTADPKIENGEEGRGTAGPDLGEDGALGKTKDVDDGAPDSEEAKTLSPVSGNHVEALAGLVKNRYLETDNIRRNANITNNSNDRDDLDCGIINNTIDNIPLEKNEVNQSARNAASELHSEFPAAMESFELDHLDDEIDNDACIRLSIGGESDILSASDLRTEAWAQSLPPPPPPPASGSSGAEHLLNLRADHLDPTSFDHEEDSTTSSFMLRQTLLKTRTEMENASDYSRILNIRNSSNNAEGSDIEVNSEDENEDGVAAANDDDDDDDISSNASSLSSGSDWDAELAIEAEESTESIGTAEGEGLGSTTLGAFQEHLEGLRNLVGNNNEDKRGAQLPRRWRFTTQIREESATPTVLRYPKPTALYSLRTREGMRFMQETALEQWLAQLVSSDQVKVREAEIEQTSQLDADPKHVRKLLGKSAPGSLEWSETYLSLVWSLYSARKDGMCAETALRLFRMLAPFASEKRRRLHKKAFSNVDKPPDATSAKLLQYHIFDKAPFSANDADSPITAETPEQPLSTRSISPPPTIPIALGYGGGTNSHRSRSVDDLESSHSGSPRRSSRELPLAPWDVFLKTILGTFHWGTLALARSGMAHAAGDLNRSRGTSRQDVPECIWSMVSETKKWVSSQVPMQLRYFVDTYVMLLEAEAAAHQLATCVLDFSRRASGGSGGVANSATSSLGHASNHSTSSSALSSSSRSTSRHLPKHMHRGGRRRASRDSWESPEPDSPQTWKFAYTPPESSAAPFLSAEGQLAETVLAQLCSAYLRASSSEYDDRKDFGCFPQADPVLIQAACLCDIQLLLCGMSPLTTSETNKLQDALDQLQLELEKWMTSDAGIEREVIDIVGTCAEGAGAGAQHPDDIGISMCIGVVHKYREASDQRMNECERLCNVDPRYRMERLLALYPRIPAYSLLKAKAAYILAMYTWDEQRNSQTAEELLFECLFVLEMQANDLPQCEGAPLLSELATNAMVLYGDILVENGKYKYAIGAYESAARSYRIREHADFQWLNRRLCSICVEHMDWDRALKYHLEILHTTKLETNLNEFVYVSERVAMMLLDQRADFAQAESYLKLALSYLGTRRSSSMDDSYYPTLHDNLTHSPATGHSSSDAHHRSLRVKLQQRLAHVLLAANRPEDAARLLERVLATLGPSSGHTGIAEVSPYLGWPSLNPSSGRDHPLHDASSAEHLQSSTSRLTVLLSLAKCCLKLRWLADCTMALDQLAQEVSHGRWCDPSYATLHAVGLQKAAIGSFPRPQPSDGMIVEFLTTLAGMSAEITMTYAILRARCTLYMGEPLEAQVWIDETLRLAGLDPAASQMDATTRTLHPNLSSSILNLTLGQVGRLFYYRGKVLQVANCPVVMAQVGYTTFPAAASRCRECGRSMPSQGDAASGDTVGGTPPSIGISTTNGHHNNHSTHGLGGGVGNHSTGGTASTQGGQTSGQREISISSAFAEDLDHGFLEMDGTFSNSGAHACIQSFWRAFEYFQLIDDALWQAKTLARIGQAELVTFANRDVSTAGETDEQADRTAILDSIEETTSMALDLCADIGYAPLMLRSLLNMTEVQGLRGEKAKAWNFWDETLQLLNMLYLTTTLSSSPASNETVGKNIPDSFSLHEERANAQLEVEKALSNFISLTSAANANDRSSSTTSPNDTKNKKCGSPRSRSSSLLESISEFEFPTCRVPGIFTPPGMTYRLLEHLTRLLRLSMGSLSDLRGSSGEQPMMEPIGRHVEMLATWNYLSDECWRQHSFIACIMLQDHVRSPIYDDYLIMYRPLRRDARGRPLPFSGASAPAYEVRSQTPNKSRYHGDSNANVASPASAPTQGTHRRNMSDSAVPQDGFGRKDRYTAQVKQRERMRQLRQQIRHGDEGCKRCRNARQAELMTTEGRTNAALWSCFHRLKLLAHGEIGHTLHMGEVFSQNLDLLRNIRSLTRATRAVTPAATVIFGSTKASKETSHQPRNVRLFKSPPARVNSLETPFLSSGDGNYVLLCGWHSELVVASRRRGSVDGVPSVSLLQVRPSRAIVELSNVAFETAISEENIVLGQIPRENLCSTLLRDPQPSLLGAWDLLRGIPLDGIFRLMATLLNEQPVVIASSLCAVRARAIEAILALIRPLSWIHMLLRNIPAPLAFALGRVFYNRIYIVGLHPSAVRSYIQGIEAAAFAAEEQPLYPTVVNLDDSWIEFPARNLRRNANIPAALRSAMVALMRGSESSDSPAASPVQLDQRQSFDLGSNSLTWGTEAQKRCARLYKGAQLALLWLLRFHNYFYEETARSFDGHRFYKSMLVEDPRGAFTQQFAHSQLFQLFLQQVELAKPVSRLRLDDALKMHLSLKARLYRTLVGLTRGCWVYMVVLDHTLELDADDLDIASLATSSVVNTSHDSSTLTVKGAPNRGSSSGSGTSSSTGSANAVTSSSHLMSAHRRNSASFFGSSAVVSASSGKSTGAQMGASSQWSSLFSSFGLYGHASHQNLSRVAAVSRVANDIQEMQLECEMRKLHRTSRQGINPNLSGPINSRLMLQQETSSSSILHRPAGAPSLSTHPNLAAAGSVQTVSSSFNDNSSFFQTKPKKKWIYLEEKRLRYHYRKSKNREKGGIPLDPARTRLIVPTSHYLQEDDSNSYGRLQATLDRTRKPKPEDIIEDPKVGCDDEHWLYLVTQLREPNKARTIKLRFLDKMEERLWVDALRVKLMNSELLLRLLETAFTSAG